MSTDYYKSLQADPTHPASPEYRAAHECCPRCGRDGLSETTMGYLFPGKDVNNTGCGCGWSGIVHDRVPKQA